MSGKVQITFNTIPRPANVESGAPEGARDRRDLRSPLLPDVPTDCPRSAAGRARHGLARGVRSAAGTFARGRQNESQLVETIRCPKWHALIAQERPLSRFSGDF